MGTVTRKETYFCYTNYFLTFLQSLHFYCEILNSITSTGLLKLIKWNSGWTAHKYVQPLMKGHKQTSLQFTGQQACTAVKNWRWIVLFLKCYVRLTKWFNLYPVHQSYYIVLNTRTLVLLLRKKDSKAKELNRRCRPHCLIDMWSLQHRNSTTINGDKKYNKLTADYHNLIIALMPVSIVRVYQLEGGNGKNWFKLTQQSRACG